MVIKDYANEKTKTFWVNWFKYAVSLTYTASIKVETDKAISLGTICFHFFPKDKKVNRSQ